ncbi:hypothetical protein QBC46DRAFT_395931 [Diplogelasinospora grovesii]|uniref:Pentatricopeptide repeat protein n=1 Tax=Diplogelasinospora grovesii TaxID=303347 RepID=A0AAN6S116_9PEZI|nr:hypothetical protein QBC46DRAFT_395931 [Diplogelasinospora grovesii]
MPPRPFPVDLGRTSSYICQSCLSSLRGGLKQQPWIPRLHSQAARKPLPPAQYSTSAARLGTSRVATPSKETQKAAAQSRDDAEHEEEEEEPPSHPVEIKYFNEDRPGHYRRIRDGSDFGGVSGGLDAEIETAINELEQQMVNTVQMLQLMEKQGQQDKADELRKQFKKTLRVQYKGKTGPEGETYGLLQIPGFSGQRRRPIAQLNQFLGRESVVKGGIPKPKDVADCWKYYSAARKTLSTSWGNVPREVWDFLWMVLSWEGPENPNRMHHIYVLAKDMQSAGVVLRDSQQLLAIEAMFIEGWQEPAIEAWKKAVVTLGSKPDTFRAYWELGVRMLCLHGDVERAQRAADTLLKAAQEAKADADARILIPIIRALATKEPASEQAWESYRRLRRLLGPSITIEDYDEVIACFLAGNCVEHGLQAFVDMMFSNAIDIRGKTKLPAAVSNQFFVGKWLKRLIGAGDLDGAYKVVVYLQAKGITASPIQLNGLIGAWLRSETAENLGKAESLAWKMIQSRLRYVTLRRRESQLSGPIRLYDNSGLSPVAEEEELPYTAKATAETFSLLAENYCQRGLHDRLQDLWEVFKQAEINTTTFMMNQLIKSHTQNSHPEEAVRFYRTMTQDQKVRPDGHTFLALFNTLSVNRLVTRDASLAEQDINAGRQFFSEMVTANWVLDDEDILIHLPRTILFSMLKAKDFAGMAIASRAMRELFSFIPTEALLIELAVGSNTLRVQTKRNMERILEGSRTIERLIKKHRRDVGQEDENVLMTPEQKATELTQVLEQLIMLKAGAQDADPKEVRPLLEAAASEMGVYDVVVKKDPNAIARHRKIAVANQG